MSLPLQFGALRTRELRELLEDEHRINHIIRCNEKFQELQKAADKTLVSNQKLAKVSLSQKPKFRDAKLLLAMKYKDLENLRSIIQAKQEQLAEKHSLHYAQWHLLQKINHADEECEVLFQRFAEGKTPLADFLYSFLKSRTSQHNRMLLLKKLQEFIESESSQRLKEIHPDAQIHEACLPVCGLPTAVVLPACCHPPYLLPCSAAQVNASHWQHSPFCHDYNGSLQPGVHGRGHKWQARPVRLQPLRVQHRRDQQAPQ